MMRQYKYMGINWKVNAEKDILGKMDCLLGDYYKESYAPKVDFEVTLVEKISSDLTEILEYGVPIATVYKGNIIKNLIMDCQSYTKYRPNETTGGIFVSWRRKEELPTGA